MVDHVAEIKLSPGKIKSILHSAESSAKAVNLVYVQDSQPGITRVKKGDSFYYKIGKKRIRDPVVIERIKHLVIPPAWESVWICNLENGHLQATGIDLRQRKQYKYHSLWSEVRSHTKFFRLREFGKALPSIRRQLEKDLALRGLPVAKVLAVVVSLMAQTSIRIGNNFYEKLYGSFGITTLKDQHVKISGSHLKFVFTGKKGVAHSVSIKSKRLARIVRNCRSIPGRQLFQYCDQDGSYRAIDSGMVNDYIKSIVGQDFTAKDFRTWAGTLQAIKAFAEVGMAETEADIKKNIVAVLDRVAEHLGNTRSVCKKYYVHPAIISLYQSNKLHAYLARLDKIKTASRGLAAEEKLLMTILEKEKAICL